MAVGMSRETAVWAMGELEVRARFEGERKKWSNKFVRYA
jgi:hypothetical protein